MKGLNLMTLSEQLHRVIFQEILGIVILWILRLAGLNQENPKIEKILIQIFLFWGMFVSLGCNLRQEVA